MIITTILYMCVLRYTWHKPWYLVAPFGIFLIIDSYTWAANVTKVPQGGWVAIMIAFGIFIPGFCWFFGQLSLRRFLRIHASTTNLHTLWMRLNSLSNSSRHNSRYSSADLPIISTANGIEFSVESDSDSDSDSDMDFETKRKEPLPKVQSLVLLLKNVPVVSSTNIPVEFQHTDLTTDHAISAAMTPGVACFLTNSKKHTPHVFENYLSRLHSVPQVIVFLQIEHTKTATVKNNERITVKVYGENIFHIKAMYGYTEYRIKPFDVLTLARTQYNVPIPHDELKVTLIVPNETIKVSTIGWRSWIRRWPLYVYALLKSLYPGAAGHIKVNPQNTVSVGILAKLE